MNLSVIVPAYNEAPTIDRLLERLTGQRLEGVEKEIIVVDDGSTDGTAEKIRVWEKRRGVTAVYHQKNQGKGKAVRSGLEKAGGDYVLIQDADLEYNPADIPNLLRLVVEQKAEVVYGSRFTGPRKNMFFWHMVGNHLLTLLTNILFNSTLSDMEVGYKLVRRELLQSLNLREDRFGFEPEVTAKLLRKGVRIFETPIAYSGREYAEGKKITWRDGIKAVFSIFRYRFFD
jgi:glycosyltransferase involved in cell wall biosynthesis